MAKNNKKVKKPVHQVIVDVLKCVGCGLCQKDCVSGVITLQDGKAVAGTTGCIACGHCEAICPQNAIQLTGFKDESIPYEEQTRLDPDVLLQAIRTRRTVRIFKEDAVPKHVVKQIIEAGRLAPTGGNGQDVSYVILGSHQVELEECAVDMFNKLLKVAKPVIPFLRNMDINEDFFFKKAPLVIVIMGSTVNGTIAAENMAFMAEAHGLGVLYSGFFTMCVNRSKTIREIMGLRKKDKAVTTLVLGYPGVKYHRTVRREAAKVKVL